MRAKRNSHSEFISLHYDLKLVSSSPYSFSMEVVYLQIFFSNFTMSSWRFCHDLDAQNKVIHSKYYKHLAYALPHQMGFGLNEWIKSWVILFTFQVFWVKITSPLFICPNGCYEQIFFSVDTTWDI